MKIRNSMKIYPVGAKLLHADSQTDGNDAAHRRPSVTLQKQLKLVKIPSYVFLYHAVAQHLIIQIETFADV
jgi:hypothetical protein